MRVFRDADENELAETGQIDFNDMINRERHQQQTGQIASPYRTPSWMSFRTFLPTGWD